MVPVGSLEPRGALGAPQALCSALFSVKSFNQSWRRGAALHSSLGSSDGIRSNVLGCRIELQALENDHYSQLLLGHPLPASQDSSQIRYDWTLHRIRSLHHESPIMFSEGGSGSI